MDHQHHKFMIDSSEAKTMAKNLGLKSVLQLLPYIIKSSQKLARIPISGFPVAAVGLASDGRIFIGVNVEFPGLPLHHSIHAEQFLVTNLSFDPHTRLENIVVSAYPCGHCRQFLQEIRGARDIQILVPKSENHMKLDPMDHDNTSHHECPSETDEEEFMPLSYFLPHRFGPDDLLDKDVPLILEDHDNSLSFEDDSIVSDKGNNNLCNGFSPLETKGLILAAFEAANKSHAPYSGCPSGLALIDEDGKIYKGSYMESAAYNPSMGPAQAAVIAYMTAAEGGAGYERLVGAVLVEVGGAIVRQEETVRLFLNAVAPNCEFHVFHCQKSGSPVKGKKE